MEWSLRLKDEYDNAISAFFITLTYNQTYLPFNYQIYKDKKWQWKPSQYIDKNGKKQLKSTLNKKHVQDYIKRLRKLHDQHAPLDHNGKKVKLRYYACGEYGSKTGRPHYHIILFNFPTSLDQTIIDKWQYGHVDIGNVNDKSINYITKYVFKDFYHKTDSRQPPYSTMSKKPIIGHSYLEKNGVHHIENGTVYKYIDGKKRRLPKAYLNRLFTNKEDKIQLIKAFYDDRKDIQTQKKQYIAKVNQYEGKNLLEKIHNYGKSQLKDFQRYKDTINHKETL